MRPRRATTRARRIRRFSLAAATAIVLVSTACSSGDPEASTPSTSIRTTTTTTIDRSDQPLETTTVFRAGEDGYASYRIPAVIALGDGTLIAFAEGRVSTAADDGNVDLLAKRSTDDGRSWGPLQIVADMGTDFIGNPSPVLDATSGRVLLLATWKAGTDTEIEILTATGADTSREYLLTSDDSGATWTAPAEITESVKRPEWRWYSVGPGHATQVPSGKHAGRLVAAANHSDDALNYGAHLILSDDGGKTWRIGASDTPKGGPRHPNEATAAVLPDGTIVVSARDQDGADDRHRLRAVSTDGGESFDTPFSDQDGLEIPVVEASLLWVPDTAADGAGRLLLSGPADNNQRVRMRVRSSIDAGVTWSDGFLVTDEPAAYSDLVLLSGRAVGVLFETGAAQANEHIDFATLGIDHLND